jgi:asparagine synthetase B (glutamine-hydrolysing)
MCGINAFISAYTGKFSAINVEKQRAFALSNSRKIRHRGPDGTGCYQINNHVFTHERLSIIDPKGGNQPLFGAGIQANITQVLCVNGEIFNYQELKKSSEFMANYPYTSGSDCEVILSLWNSYGGGTKITEANAIELLGKLNGQFSFILYESDKNTGLETVFIARDPFGITSLYYGITNNTNNTDNPANDIENTGFYVASEMKALRKTPAISNISVFPNGHMMLFSRDIAKSNEYIEADGNIGLTNEISLYLSRIIATTNNADDAVKADTYRKLLQICSTINGLEHTDLFNIIELIINNVKSVGSTIGNMETLEKFCYFLKSTSHSFYSNPNYELSITSKIRTLIKSINDAYLNVIEETAKPIEYFSRLPIGNWLVEGYNNTYPKFEHMLTNNSYDNPEYTRIREAFINAVKIRMVSDVPYGVLLSGGLDSSLVASIVSRYYHDNSSGNDIPTIHKLNTFSIGLKDAPDLIKARVVAKHIGSEHHEFIFTLQEAWDALPDVIRALETYDITTIRASTPMYLMSRKIKALGIKMVLSGEGSDELLGGYLYFHQAPDDISHQMECKRRLRDLAYFDCLRADKSTMSWGLEARVPFLDVNFVNTCIDIPMNIKAQNKMEKYVLRRAFDSKDIEGEDKCFLPDDILWRQKEQFSDGVGYGWIDYLKDTTNKLVTDEEFSWASRKFPHNSPATKEAFYYRKVYEEIFGAGCAVTTVKKWIPNQEWSGVSADPSGRAQLTHIATTS